MGRPVAEGVFSTDADGPRLLGAGCADCGAVRFPAAETCARCSGAAMESVMLARRGLLWSFTVQGFRPKSPPYAGTEAAEAFVPFGVGYVDLEDLIVEARLTVSNPARLRIGMEMELVVVPFPDGSDGAVLTYAFQPAEAARAGAP